MSSILPRAAVLFLLVVLAPRPAAGQAVQQPEQYLHYLFPAGARQGQTLTVEFGGAPGLAGSTSVVIDGPPGITVRDVKPTPGKPFTIQAAFAVAADAPVGKRLVRLAGGACGLTNARPFFISRLPEVLEKEPNNAPETAHEVELPAVVNARIDPATDVDCFAFRARTGQRIVAGVFAHGMDTLLRGGRLYGFLDTSLELLDDKGRIVAAAEDTLGLDPLLDFTIKADGRYTVRVQSLFFKGAPSAVYRLTLGEVPYPTHVFPPGGKRGEKISVEFSGPNVAPGAKQLVAIPAEGMPWIGAALDHPLCDGREMPLAAGGFPERVESEPNDTLKTATPLPLPSTVNSRFDRRGDEDWYRVSLKKGQGIVAEVTAQRHLRSSADTHLRITDATGKTLAENDDGALFAHPNQCAHDFGSSDSWLPFTAPADGDYSICLTDQSGIAGPLAFYRLSVSEMKPDFLLSQWPDAVPVWGSGTTASFVVHVQMWGGMKSDIKLRIEGLPPGWTGSTIIVSHAHYAPFVPPYGIQALMTITAPPNAAVGALANFRVVGRAEQDGMVIERTALPMTLYGSSHTDRMHLRYSPLSRAAVAPPLDSWLETPVRELTVRMGQTVEIPVKVHRQAGYKGELAVSVDGPINGGAARCDWRTPTALKPGQEDVKIVLTPNPERKPGVYSIVVSRTWAADLRAGRPGPCTPIITLTILPAK